MGHEGASPNNTIDHANDVLLIEWTEVLANLNNEFKEGFKHNAKFNKSRFVEEATCAE